jgi:hypothetical protein
MATLEEVGPPGHPLAELQTREFRLRRRTILVALFTLLFPPLIVWTFVNLWRLGNLQRDLRIVQAGVTGELSTRAVFLNLDDRYTVLPDLTIEVEGRRSQIDHIVVGPTGVFVVETKNLNGYIEGAAEDREIVQHKIGRRGGRYSKRLYNPVHQVRTHVHRVSRLLKSHGLQSWVNAAVYFANPDAVVDLDGGSVRVFSARDDGARRLLAFVETPYEYISPAAQAAIVDLIKTAAVRGETIA